jgi:hypothetical protein
MHLVEDDRAHPPQRLPRSRGEQQEQRLRGGHQHVGRGAGEQATLVGRGVAGPHRHRDLRRRRPLALRGLPDPGQWRAQVALHVDRQRLERGDVEHPAAVAGVVGRRLGRQPVERPEERRERLP